MTRLALLALLFMTACSIPVAPPSSDAGAVTAQGDAGPVDAWDRTGCLDVAAAYERARARFPGCSYDWPSCPRELSNEECITMFDGAVSCGHLGVEVLAVTEVIRRERTPDGVVLVLRTHGADYEEGEIRMLPCAICRWNYEPARERRGVYDKVSPLFYYPHERHVCRWCIARPAIQAAIASASREIALIQHGAFG